jgi:HPr kinase/phosphorylase
MGRKFTVLDLLDLDLKEHNALDLNCLGGRKGLIREISVPDVNRPGLALSGFFEDFANQRLQIFGRGEYAYLQKLREENNEENVRKLFSFEIPCVIFTHGLKPGDKLIAMAEEHSCPILQSDLDTSEFTSRLLRALSNIFAPTRIFHGVLVEVFGIGVLITGSSGVGKSESALELIERGHRLVADDAVEIKCVNGNYLMGTTGNQVMGHHLEIRGLGILNIAHLFGVGAIRDKKQVQLIVDLEEWDTEKVYERLGVKETTKDILGVQIPIVPIPIKPGRHVPIIIETAAMNERLKKMGYYSAQEFNQNFQKWLESENARAAYLRRNEF